MSKTVVMLTEENEMIGFLLFAAEKSIFTEMGWEGHCIFTGAPKDSKVFDNPLCIYLQDNKNIEFNAKIISSDAGYSLIIRRLLSAELSKDLNGSWSPVNQNTKGFCLVPNTAS
ncbi:MAG: hypothetical protein ACSHWP_02585 [Pseudoalteromonas sp.]